MRWLFRVVGLVWLAVSSPAFASTCDDVSANVGQELPFGLAFAQNLHQVFCQMKKTAPETIYFFEYSTGTWCRGIQLRNVGWRTSDYRSLEVFFNGVSAELQKHLSQIDKDVRPTTAACYAFAPSVARLVDIVRDVEPIDHRLTLLEPTLRFQNFEFLGVKGTLQPIFAINRSGLAALINNLQRNNKDATIRVNNAEYSVLTSVVGAQFITPMLKDPNQLTQMRREALPFFKRVLAAYPGTISQEDTFPGAASQNEASADLVITRSFYTILMSFNEATGVIRIATRLNAGLKPADYISDQKTLDRLNWLSSHMVRSR